MTAGRTRPTHPDAWLFDLDGVVTDTARVHRVAWAAMFTEYLGAYAPDAAPYEESDYREHIDGKPRLDGVRSLLRSRGLVLPEDAPEGPSVASLGERKNALFLRLLDGDGVSVFPDAAALLDAIVPSLAPRAIVSSSRNASPVLAAAGLGCRFTTVVDGEVAIREGLGGKPAPDMFTYAAKALGGNPADTIVLEDAVSGVAAGRAGGFWVVGVDRTGDALPLLAAGADEVVTDLAALVRPLIR